MSKPNYRVNVTFDGERKLFMARAPELDHCSAEGSSRAEAIARLEEEIDAQLANMLSHGSTPPRSVDEETFSGEISAKISKGLHKEIAYQARSEGVELELLVAELLAAATESRKSTRAPRSGNRPPVDQDNIGNRAPAENSRGGDGNRGGGPRAFGRGGNSAVMDDRATFIEYVRGLEQSGGHSGGHRGHQGGGGGGGPQGGGGVGADGRRRRRGGRGGQGGNPNFRGGPNGGGGHNDRHFSGGGGNGAPRPNGNGAPPHAPGHAEPSHNAAPPSETPRGPGGDDSGNA